VQLLDPRFKHQIGLQDPHNSSPGRQFLNWVVAFNHDQTGDFLRRLQPNVQSVSPSWAFSYGLFEKRQVRLVFSYLTSLAYHWGMDHDRGFQVTQFAEGHPLQVEFVGVPKSCRQCRLGQLLASTLLEPWAQKLIMERNFMRPVLQSAEQNTVFAELPKLKTLRLEDSTQKYLREWDEIFKH
jgi:thiamine transport system substrate-binding protein